MCGIAGSLTNYKISEDKSRKILSLLHHRGPDGRSTSTHIYNDKIISFFHTRLSIIDLNKRSSQPMNYKYATIIFNGEIYNYIELKKYLKNKGYNFQTNSDTEVLLACYIHWGEKFTDHLNGMWSMSIWDKKNKKLILSRDRFGEKPLYYTLNNNNLFFASETKVLKCFLDQKIKLNEKLLKNYLVFGHKYMQKNHNTFYKNIRLLEPGTNIIWNKNKVQKKIYWKISLRQNKISLNDAIYGVKEHLDRSVKLRLRSDVPIAFHLSGGVDSNFLLGSSINHLKYLPTSFSIIDKDQRYDESENINKANKFFNIKNIKININKKDNHLELIKNLTIQHDAPISTISSYVSSLLSKEMKKMGFKVSISGLAADEIFAGYYEHNNLNLIDFRKNKKLFNYFEKNWKKNIQSFIRNPFLKTMKHFIKDENFFENRILNYKVFQDCLIDTNLDLKKITKQKFYCKSRLRNRMLNELFYEQTQIWTMQDDKNSMYSSIENRSPYLDRDLIEFVYSLPQKYLMHDGIPKYLLREASRNIINEDIRSDYRKKGFNADIKSLINFSNKSMINNDLLNDSYIFEFVSKKKIKKLLNLNKFDNSYKKFIFSFITAKNFLDNCF